MIRTFLAAALLVASQAGAADRPPPAPEILWLTNEVNTAVELAGLPPPLLLQLRNQSFDTAAWEQIFRVHVLVENPVVQIGLPAIAGEYSLTERGVRFQPGFPFDAGVAYRASFDPEHLPGAPELSRTSSVLRIRAEKRVPNVVVERIYPSAEVLPENLLKFYITFSGSMSSGHIYEHIHLLNEKREPVELPFLEIDEELWNPGMTRLTLFLDPGRIKRGVLPLEGIGPALQEGKSYVLAIGSGWLDGSGTPLKSSFEKSFRVGPADREPIHPDRWKLTVPPAGARDPFVITFPEPLDHALAVRMISIRSETGKVISGEKSLERDETQLVFRPVDPWKPGPHKLVIQNIIEDLAGNNIGKPFEVDLFERVERHLSEETTEIAFEVRQPETAQ